MKSAKLSTEATPKPVVKGKKPAAKKTVWRKRQITQKQQEEL
jgi:hypothetical protein